MPANIYYEQDADLGLLHGKTIAILGYGSQGHAQALNLRDSGCRVIVGQRSNSPNFDLAVSHGFDPLTLDEAASARTLSTCCFRMKSKRTFFRNTSVGIWYRATS